MRDDGVQPAGGDGIRYHKGADRLNDRIDIKPLGEPGPGGAHSRFMAYVPHDEFNEELNASVVVHISFQNGDPFNAINGITNETLLAILIYRLAEFQAGPHPCEENREAQLHCQAALMELQARSRRLNRA